MEGLVANGMSYGEIKNGLFIQHKWISLNKKPGIIPRGYIAYFRHESKKITDFSGFSTITKDEYTTMYYNDYQRH